MKRHEHPDFPAAVKTVADRVLGAMPTIGDRLTRAVTLVLDGHVSVDVDPSDGQPHFRVTSQKDLEQHYWVNGRCECPDAEQAPNGWCKHRIASGIYRRAYEMLDADDVVQAPHDPAPDLAGMPEAPASVNGYITVQGVKCQFTLRDVDEHRLMARLHIFLDEHGTTAAQRAPAGDAIPDDIPDPDQSFEGWCPKHQVQMKLHSNETGSWWSHHDDTSPKGWCHG